MKSIFYKTLGGLLVAVMATSASFARVDESLLDELCGIAPNPNRKDSELEGAYLEALTSVAGRIGSKVELDRTKTVHHFRAMAAHAGQPDNENMRKAFCDAIAQVLAKPDYPALGRRKLIEALGQIGGDESVPVLAKLIAAEGAIEPDLARMSLHQIPGKLADVALLDALKATKDNTRRIGVIDSIGARKIGGAIPVLTPLLADADAGVAAAAATAMGRIGDASTKALAAARSTTPDDQPERQRFLELALLDIANQRGVAGNREGAGKIFQLMGRKTQHLAVKAAAMIGTARATPKVADEMVILAIKSDNQRLRSVGISAATAVPSRRLALGMAKLLPTQNKDIQIQLLNALAAKGDKSVQEQVVEFLRSQEGKDEELEAAALRALGTVGTVKIIEMLLEKSVARPKAINEAARAALGELRGQDIAQTIEFHARQGKTPEIRAVAIGLFMRNRDRTGLTRIVSFAEDPNLDVCKAAMSVLRKEAGDKEFRKLLDLLTANRPGVMPVITAVCGRAESPNLITSEIVTYLRENESVRYQRFLMSCLPILGSPAGLQLLTENIGPGKAATDAALKGLAKWPTGLALPEMLKMLEKRKDDRSSVSLMTVGIARLAVDATEISLNNRARYINEAFGHCPNARERQILLPAMAKIPHPDTADIVLDMLKDRYVSSYAASAAVSLAHLMIEPHPDTAKALALGVSKGNFNSSLKTEAGVVLKKLNAATKKDF